MENIYTSVQTTLFLSKMTGLFPVSFKGPSYDGVLSTELSNVIFSSLSFLLLIAFTILSLTFDLYAYEGSSSLLKHAWSISLKVDFVSHICLFIFQLTRKRTVVQFLAQVQDADEKVRLEKAFKIKYLSFVCFRQIN